MKIPNTDPHHWLKWIAGWALLVGLLLGGCVTVYVYSPVEIDVELTNSEILTNKTGETLRITDPNSGVYSDWRG